MAKLRLSRAQLATFLKDHEQIKAFERLFSVVEEETPDSIDEIRLEAGSAIAIANAALSLAATMQEILDRLDSAPAPEQNNSVATDYIDLPEDGPHETVPRRIQWNLDDGTVDIGLYNGSVLQVGQESMYYAKNTSGALIANGTPVMFTGTVGASGKLTFGLSVADGTSPAEYMMGVATQDIDNNAFGYVTTFGLVRGFDTSGSPYSETWADGELLYFDPATPGAWTNVAPDAPNIRVPVAVVINAASGGAGSILVRMSIGETIDSLQDAFISGVAEGHILSYDATNLRWRNEAPGVVPIRSVTASTTVTAADGTILADCTGGDVGVTFPAASVASGRVYTVKRMDASSNVVTLLPDSSETFDGSASAPINVQYESLSVQSDGANWVII